MTGIGRASLCAGTAVVSALLVTTAAAASSSASASAAQAVTSTAVAGPSVRFPDISEATCPDGFHLISGGYRLFTGFSVPEGTPQGIVVTNAPSVSKPNTWEAKADQGSGGVFASEIQAVALCETGS